MTTPTIHLNGTSGADLLEGYRTAMEAVASAQHALQSVYPNARDYYPQGPEAIQTAILEHKARWDKLQAVYLELHELAIHCDTINTEREARRNRS